MNNKKLIISVIVLIILLIIVLGFFYFKNFNQNNNLDLGKDVKIDDIKYSISGEVEKTNPFKADVNPYNGYKNPFAN